MADTNKQWRCQLQCDECKDTEYVEVVPGINSLKLGKAARIDKVTPDVFESEGEPVAKALVKLFKIVWDISITTSERKNNTTIPIHRKGISDNYLLICLSTILYCTVLYKIHTKVSERSLRSVVNHLTEEEQAVFRSGG